ncbi:MAG: chemotaxis protein CheX [Lachnospiraceae bacterium]|nr:chemotaxis protein CheX [Lachnospiraceae bacterium]
MFSQFFGSYLLRKEVITSEQLAEAISKVSETHIKLGTLAIHSGYMVASEVDEVCYLQSREDKRFGEIAIERGYLTEDQVKELLKIQTPYYLLLGQCLVDMGAITNTDLQDCTIGYESENELIDIDLSNESTDKIRQLIERFFVIAEIPVSEYSVMYMELLFNNLIRFIGDDFTPLTPFPCAEYPTNYCVTQEINGEVNCKSRIDMPRDVAIEFASRFINEDFETFDDYVQASIEDFMNLHNGLFVVNMSNSFSIELNLQPPAIETEDVLQLSEATFILPIIYPFGTIHILISLVDA